MMSRRASRIQVVHSIAIQLGPERIPHTVIDVSITGLGALGPLPRAPGEIVRVEWPLAGRGRAFAEVAVVRSEPEAGGLHVLGFQFRRVDPELQRELSQHIMARPRVRTCQSGFLKRISHGPATPRAVPPVLISTLETLLPRDDRELEELYRLAVHEVERFDSRSNRSEEHAWTSISPRP